MAKKERAAEDRPTAATVTAGRVDEVPLTAVGQEALHSLKSCIKRIAEINAAVFGDTTTLETELVSPLGSLRATAYAVAGAANEMDVALAKLLARAAR